MFHVVHVGLDVLLPFLLGSGLFFLFGRSFLFLWLVRRFLLVWVLNL